MYVNDWDERWMPWGQQGCNVVSLPVGDYYKPYCLLNPYIKNHQIWDCPSRTHRTHPITGAGCSYHFNCFGFFEDWRYFAISEAEIQQPAAKIAAQCMWDEAGWFEGNPMDGCGDVPFQAPRDTCPWHYRQFTVHNEGTNFLYCDGHVKWQRPERIRRWDYELKWP